jgi:hypothetical protein
MPPQPGRTRQIKLQIAIRDGSVISFANISENKHAGRNRCSTWRLRTHGRIKRSQDRESHSVPNPLRRRPVTAAGVPQVAEILQNPLLWHFAFVSGSCAVPAPSTTQWKPCWMRPGAILQSRYGHEIRAGHASPLRSGKLLGLAIVISSCKSGEFSMTSKHARA